MLLKIVLVSMVILAVAAVETSRLRPVVIYLGIFSFVSSFAYLLYGAPDVAIAEAVIGSTLATVLFLVALKKYAVFTIYCISEKLSLITDQALRNSDNGLLELIENHCIDKELEPQVIHTPESIPNVISNHAYDLIIEKSPVCCRIIGNRENYQLDEIFEMVKKEYGSEVEIMREDYI